MGGQTIAGGANAFLVSVGSLTCAPRYADVENY